MRLLKLLSALTFVLLACGRSTTGPNPTPNPPPIPQPTPTPVVSTYPFGAILCCDNPETAIDEGLRDGWSLASVSGLERIATAGATSTVFRTGPYRDGSSSIPGLVGAVAAANSVGIKPEIDLIDSWALANGETPWGDTCEVTHSAPAVRHLKHVRAVVEATKDFNVNYNVSNELFRCSPSEDWVQGILLEAKLAGAKDVGCEASSMSGVGEWANCDHWSIGDTFEPTSNGVTLTEDDGNFHTPEEWIELFKQSRARGGHVMFWRGSMSDAEFARLLSLARSIQ